MLSVFLYARETWTLTAEIQRRIEELETRCCRRILGISYLDRIANEESKRTITAALGPHEDLLTIVKKRKMKC